MESISNVDFTSSKKKKDKKSFDELDSTFTEITRKKMESISNVDYVKTEKKRETDKPFPKMASLSHLDLDMLPQKSEKKKEFTIHKQTDSTTTTKTKKKKKSGRNSMEVQNKKTSSLTVSIHKDENRHKEFYSSLDMTRSKRNSFSLPKTEFTRSTSDSDDSSTSSSEDINQILRDFSIETKKKKKRTSEVIRSGGKKKRLSKEKEIDYSLTITVDKSKHKPKFSRLGSDLG